MSGGLILAADIGGTNCKVGIFDPKVGPVDPIIERTIESRSAEGPADLLLPIIKAADRAIEIIVVGIAGPVVDGEVITTNLPWRFSVRELQRELGGRPLHVINDLIATGWGVDVLPPGNIATIQSGKPDPVGNRALISVGTGLGEVLMAGEGDNFAPSPSEGGHVGFAPLNIEDEALLSYLREKYGRVSYERVVSGKGLKDLYSFLVETGRQPLSADLNLKMAEEDPALVILNEGLNGKDPACVAVLKIFIRHLGAKAGDLALAGYSTGGIYLGGGVVLKLADQLGVGDFLSNFGDKGRMSALAKRIPINILMDTKTALYGAARYGIKLSNNTLSQFS